jgi:ABC-2 type transport system permease protein
MKIYFRYPINVVMTLFEPLMWLAPFYFMGKSFSQGGKVTGFEAYTGNSDFIGFLVVGFMVSTYVGTVFWSLGFSLKEEMRQGVLESNWSAPVNRITMLISKCLFQFCAATFEIVLTGIVCYFAFGFRMTPDILKAIGFLIPGIIGMLGIGMGISALVLMAKDANPIIDLSNSIFSALSGSYFPVKVMPKFFVFISMMLPMTYLYDSSRTILVGQNPILPLNQQFIILLAAMVIFFFLGSWIFMKVEKKCRKLGILGTH